MELEQDDTDVVVVVCACCVDEHVDELAETVLWDDVDEHDALDWLLSVVVVSNPRVLELVVLRPTVDDDDTEQLQLLVSLAGAVLDHPGFGKAFTLYIIQ